MCYAVIGGLGFMTSQELGRAIQEVWVLFKQRGIEVDRVFQRVNVLKDGEGFLS